VLSVDEKSQIQALDRTQPILPLRPGLPERQTHDYERHGTTTLFAALNVAAGKIIAQCQPRHRHQEFLRFLKQIDGATDPARDVHLILDNYGTHKHPQVQKWFRANIRVTHVVSHKLRPCAFAQHMVGMHGAGSSENTLYRSNRPNLCKCCL
jgi:transposase